MGAPYELERVFGHMRTAKTQISLRNRAVWSAPLLSANRFIEYYRMYEMYESKRADETAYF